MSLKFPYIDISITVANPGEATSTILSHQAPTVDFPSLHSLTENFDNLSEGYLMWGDERRAFSLFILSRDPSQPQPRLTVTLLMDRDILMPGRTIVNLLSDIKGRILDGETLTADILDRMIENAGFPAEPLRSLCDAWPTAETSGLCYRTYASGSELANLLGFPRQKCYEEYRGVLLTPAAASPTLINTIPQITTALDKSLFVVCPAGVSASAPRVDFSDHLTLTYSCPGFDSVSVMFEVGTTNRYVRINGPALLVNNARHAGIIFRRRIPYTVITVGGSPIDTYTILINGRTANRTEEGFEISNTDFESGRVKITVSSTNFSTYSQEFTPESLEQAAPIHIVLEPESREILLRLDFGDGRVVEETLNIEKNTPEYCQLRAGRFHGFRAHRLMGSTPETYNIDVKPSYAPAAPADGPRGTETISAPTALFTPTDKDADEPHGPVAPVVEKAPSAIHREEKRERRAPEFTNETIASNHEGEETGSQTKDNRRFIIGLIGVVAFGLLVWWIAGLLSGKSADNADVADSAATAAQTAPASVEGSPAVPAATPTAAASLTPDENADIEYLNANKVWRESALKSEKYRALYTAFGQGDVDAIVGHDYFTAKGRANNRDAVRVADFLWEAKGSNQQRAQERKLKKLAGKSEINIHQLMDDIAKSRPTEAEANKSPRPGM